MAYTKRHHYTSAELARASLRDLIVDIRCARRDGPELADYATKCAERVRAIWPWRHDPVIGRFGEVSGRAGASR